METIFRERVEEIILPRVLKGRLLDVGCSSGHFLKVAHDHGFDVYGIEPNPDMVKFATEQLELPNVRAGVLKGSDYSPNYFDVITLWDVLEHVPSPHELLLEVFQILKLGGWVFAYTENVESFNVFVTGVDSEMFAPDVHLRHYSAKTFRMEFENAGFMVRNVMTKGLDIQHIGTTIKVNPGKYPEDEFRPMFESPIQWQAVINACGKGDNLRLFAKKEV
jgi:2-polyprenyl-3-methyl-5-hydroxy-6-metoxy-1,4-benzoquinol methylase